MSCMVNSTRSIISPDKGSSHYLILLSNDAANHMYNGNLDILSDIFPIVANKGSIGWLFTYGF
jgi:hypothetical protein